MTEEEFFQAQNFEEKRMRRIDYVVLHCTATPQTTTVESIQKYWRTPKPHGQGWRDPGYHHIILPSGEIVDLQPIEKPSNGVGGYNAHSIHISYIGGVDKNGKAKDNRTVQQLCAMEYLVRKYRKMFPAAIIQGHRDFPNVKKDCPSFPVKEWLQELKIK